MNLLSPASTIDDQLDQLLTRVQRVSETDYGFRACCPGHNGNELSLSIFERGGRILPYCWDDCSTEKILRSIGLEMSARFIDLEKEVPKSNTKEPKERSDYAEFFFDPAATSEPDEWIFEGFLHKGELVTWLGREKHSKTTLALQMVICAAVGKPFLNFRFAPAKPLKVLVIDYESKTGTIRKRYDAICRGLGLTKDEQRNVEENLKILEVRKMRIEGELDLPPLATGNKSKLQFNVEEWKSLIAEHCADIYIIDPLRCAHYLDENDSQIANLMISLQRLFKGSTIILLHHLRKSDDQAESDQKLIERDIHQWSDRARGSGAIKAHADLIVCQVRSEEEETGPAIFWGAFGRDIADIDVKKLEESDPDSFTWTPVKRVPQKLQKSWQVLREHVRAAPNTPRDKRELVEVILSNKVSEATAYRHFDSLVQAGFLVRPPDSPNYILDEKLV